MKSNKSVSDLVSKWVGQSTTNKSGDKDREEDVNELFKPRPNRLGVGASSTNKTKTTDQLERTLKRKLKQEKTEDVQDKKKG